MNYAQANYEALQADLTAARAEIERLQEAFIAVTDERVRYENVIVFNRANVQAIAARYCLALRNREHGGIAAGRAADAICALAGIRWDTTPIAELEAMAQAAARQEG